MTKKLLDKQLLQDSTVFKTQDYHYHQSELKAGIVHIGLGNFHRAHQACYLDKLFDLREDFEFGIVGAGIRPYDAKMREDLFRQDWLSTLIVSDQNSQEIRVLQSMMDFLPIEEGNHALIAMMCQPNIKIVSLTVTEGGYYFDPLGKFDTSHEDIQYDAKNLQTPRSIFGILLRAIKLRKDLGTAPFTVLSCDNIPSNGQVVKNALLILSEMIYPALVEYISSLHFPNSMVDRITPATTNEHIEYLQNTHSYIDSRPVACEPFTQWCLEDKFNNDRPKLELVGVKFVQEIEQYETMKLHILNGSHAIIAYPAHLLGIGFAHEAMETKLILDFLNKIIITEVLPVVEAPTGIDTSEYFEIVKGRFANPYIKDTITRLCLDGFNRQPKFILSSIHKALATSKNIKGLALANALWCRYCAGYDEQNNAYEVADDNREMLKQKALKAKDNPREFLNIKEVYGDLADDEVFCALFDESLRGLYANGVEKSLRGYLG